MWSWCLHRWFYTPAVRAVPRPAAMMLTFAASGVVHNALAWGLSHGKASLFTTVWFVLLGAVTVLTELLRVRLDALPRLVRAVVILGYLVACYRLAALVVGE